MKTIDRIATYIDAVGISKNAFDLKINAGNGYIGKQISKSASIGSEMIEKIICEFPDLNPTWLITGEGSMLKTDTAVVVRPQRGVPLIPIDAMAGFGTGLVQVMDYDADTYNVPEFTELQVDFMIRVKGSSMYPKYSSGDLVACKKLAISDVFFQWNKVYVLDTEQGAIIKRLKPSEKANHITLLSENPNYDPLELSLTKVNAIALVVGVIRLE